MDSPPRYVRDPIEVIHYREIQDIYGNTIPEPFISMLSDIQWPSKEDYECEDIDAFIREKGVLQFMVNAKYRHSLSRLLQYRGVAKAQTVYIQTLRKGFILK